ncbi:MAG: DMT family transporter [Gemmatimonadota bacterium]|jgi:transporter family-2 protein
MNRSWMLTLIAACGGVAAGLQAHFMGLMDRSIGTRESVFITYALGGLIAVLGMLFWRGGSNLRAWHDAPWYSLGAGVLGLIIVGTVAYTVPRVGLSRAFTAIVAAQFTVAALIDHFGLLGAIARPLDASRLLGIGVLVAGVWLMVR